MDNQQEEIQSLSFYGIFLESFTIILSWKILFCQITIATIFPLSLLFLIHLLISEFFFAYWSFKLAYLVLSLVSTSAVVYAVACVYARKDIAFAEVIISAVVPKVWKRLMVTFAWSFLIVLVYNMAWLHLSTDLIPGRIPLFVAYMMGFVYLSIIWHLASVVSVLEEDCGIDAMLKSRRLVKGKMVISGGVFLLLNLCFVLIQGVFMRFVVGARELFWSRIMWGILCLLLLCGFTLLALVTQTVTKLLFI